VKALTNKPSLIPGTDPEDEAATIDLHQFGAGGDSAAHLGCRQMADSYQSADSGFAFLQLRLYKCPGRTFHQPDHHWCAEDMYASGAEMGRGMLLSYDK
jgi:hypothetical protein